MSPTRCELFVKLRQYSGPGRTQHRVDTTTGSWEALPIAGVSRLPLYAEPEHPETMHLLRIEAGAAVPEVALPGGEELLVLDGTLHDEHGDSRAGTWIRYPPGTRHTPRTATGCRWFVKKGHLALP